MFENVASSGFFAWLARHYTAPYVFMECKNYTGDLGNDALINWPGDFRRAGAPSASFSAASSTTRSCFFKI